MLQISERRAKERNLNNIKFVKTKNYKLPIEDRIFNKILLVNVYHEFNDKKKMICELNRTLKKNGYLYLIDWKCEEMDLGPPPEHRVAPEKVVNDFEKNGFIMINNKEIYQFNYVIVFRKN